MLTELEDHVTTMSWFPFSGLLGRPVILFTSGTSTITTITAATHAITITAITPTHAITIIMITAATHTITAITGAQLLV